ncbi:MAG: hypothetical protein WC629_00180 [Candidatus Paceibacterota bacterium]|jgi:hypothetical protein
MNFKNKTFLKGIFTMSVIVLSFFVSGPENKAFAACGTGSDCFPTVQGSCYANVSRGQTGDIITWTADAYDGNGYYSFDWSGTDGLASFYPVIDKRYTTSGTKIGTVQITSYGVTITRTCSVLIEDAVTTTTTTVVTNNYSSLSGYCQASGSNSNNQVNWQAYPSGGNGNYTYSWSGDTSGSSQNVSENYDNNLGNKRATVTISSNGSSITRTCSTYVYEPYTYSYNNNYNNYSNLSAYCTASPSNPSIGQVVNWSVSASGGNGNYSYSWNGSDGIYYGSNQTVYKSYDTAGTKTATVRVYSNGQSRNITCSANVQNSGGIYLSSIPATGISPNLKTILFVSGLVMWSAFLGYLYVARRNEKLREKEILESLK